MPMAPFQDSWLQGGMLRSAAFHADAPQAERCRLQLLTHQCDDGCFVQLELRLDRLEGGTVLPCHLDDPGYIGSIESAGRLWHIAW